MLAVEGYVPGWCISTSLTVNDRFVILAGFRGRRINEFVARKTMQADWTELPDYTRACGLRKMYPLGKNLFRFYRAMHFRY